MISVAEKALIFLSRSQMVSSPSEWSLGVRLRWDYVSVLRPSPRVFPAALHLERTRLGLREYEMVTHGSRKGNLLRKKAVVSARNLCLPVGLDLLVTTSDSFLDVRFNAANKSVNCTTNTGEQVSKGTFPPKQR